MANGSISGLVSGLDTATIIDQLMQLEAVPQNRLKTPAGAPRRRSLSALQSLNTDSPCSPAKREPPWPSRRPGRPSSATSSNPRSPSPGRRPRPRQLLRHRGPARRRRPDRLRHRRRARRPPSTAGTVTLRTADGKDLRGPEHAPPATVTLSELVKAINDLPRTGVSATTVKDRSPTAATGCCVHVRRRPAPDATFTLTNVDGVGLLGEPTSRPGQDAKISIGARHRRHLVHQHLHRHRARRRA